MASESISMLVIIVAVLISGFGIYQASTQVFGNVSEAQTNVQETIHDQQETDFEYTVIQSGEDVELNVTNTGDKQIKIEDMTVMYNGDTITFEAGESSLIFNESFITVDSIEIDENSDKKLLNPGSTMTVEIDTRATDPKRFKIVTKTGVERGVNL